LGLLEDKRAQSLDRAFRLLQILHRGEDIRSVELSLQSEDVRERGRAIEFLDALTQEGASGDVEVSGLVSEVREMFRLAADDLPDAERALRAGAFLPDAPGSYEEVIGALIAEQDTALAAFSAYHALELGNEALRGAVLEACEARPSLRTEALMEIWGAGTATGTATDTGTGADTDTDTGTATGADTGAASNTTENTSISIEMHHVG
ncbi:MAG: hypothetical protein L6Q76_34535, partial [Polyangiaceae bacterium]|nr:hypothetical protein [Polyangiaceae bacterium]